MKFGINCGHTVSGAGSGAVGIINESVETRAVGNALIDLLIDNGHEVVNCTINKAVTQNAYLKEVVNLANDKTLDYFISVHFNAGGGEGVEVYTYKGKKFTDALEVCANISKLGFKNRGVKDGSKLYVVNKTKAKALLIECCFIDTEDANKYKQLGAQKVAEAIYMAIVDTNSVVTNPQPENKPATGGYTGGSIVDYLNSINKDSSFNARKQYAKEYRIDNYSGTAEQNTALLNAMRGSVNVATANNYYPAFNSSSIVDGLKSIGVDNSYSHRKKIASANGIVNYSGSALQNETLCCLAKQGKLIKV